MAMKVNELMVGDWVNMGNPVTDELVPTKIENIYGEEINCKTDHTSDDVPTIIYGEWLRYAQPIPLTEEILVKNRFALDKTLAEIGTKVYTRPCPASELSVKVFHDGSIRFGFIKLTYVHTLQHLLRLCGIEKEIEL